MASKPVEILTLTDGSIDTSHDPPHRASHGSKEHFLWTCPGADFRVYDVRWASCHHPPGEVCHHPVYPFTTVMNDGFTAREHVLKSPAIKKEAVGAEYKTTWQTRKNGVDKAPYDPHIYIDP